MTDKHSKQSQTILGGLCVVLILAIGYGWYHYTNQINTLETEKSDLASKTVALEQERDENEADIGELEQENQLLSEALEQEREKNRVFEEQIGDITETVGTLDKLARTDPELLQKYSRVYFLNEHYAPKELESIPDEYLYYEDRPESIEERIWPRLQELIDDAEEDDIELYVYSAYRSHDEQAQLKAAYTVTYGSGANTFSADQGYSEHQLGTTVDFMTTGIGGSLYNFDTTEAYQWLLDNAHEYGFTLSYPENNEYYIFEPWHWRFVGEELAQYLHNEELNFHDVPQREIDDYLVTFFD